MRIRKVNSRGFFTKGKSLAKGSPSSSGHFTDRNEAGDVLSVTMFFVTEKEDGSGAWQETGLTLTVEEIKEFAIRAKFIRS